MGLIRREAVCLSAAARCAIVSICRCSCRGKFPDPVTKYKLPLFIGGEQKEAPQSGTEGDKGGMALSRKLRLGSTLKLNLNPSSASGQRNAKAAWL